MKVKRIVSNVAGSDVEKARAFYKEVLGLNVLMDLGWIRTYGSSSKMTIQVSVMSEGGSGTAVPDMSIEVDNVEEALTRVRNAGIPIEYGPATEPWGVRRFYVRDPFGWCQEPFPSASRSFLRSPNYHTDGIGSSLFKETALLENFSRRD